MEPNTKKGLSFSQIAAQQPERQRFSFSSYVKDKQTPTEWRDSILPRTAMVRSSSIRNPIERKTSVGEKVKEWTIPGRGYTDAQIYGGGVTIKDGKVTAPDTNLFDTSYKDRVVGVAKGIGEIGFGISQISRMGLSKIPGYDKLFPTNKDFLERVSKALEPKTVGEARVMRQLDIAGFASIGKVGRISKAEDLIALSKEAKNPSAARLVLKNAGATDELINTLKLDAKIAAAKTADDVVKVFSEVSKEFPTKGTFSFSQMAKAQKPADIEAVRDNIIQRLSDNVPVERVPGATKANILPEEGIVSAVQDAIDTLKKNPKPTIQQLNEAIQAAKVSGRRVDDLIDDMATFKTPDTYTQRAGVVDIKPKKQNTFSFVRDALKDPARRQQGSIGGVPEGFPGQRKLDNQSVPLAKDTTPTTKIEQRFVENFPELNSADRMAEMRNRTRGVRSNAESLDAARELGYTPDTVLRIPEGKALNAEQKMAVSGVVENERLVLKRMEDRLKTLTKGTDEFNTLRAEASRQKVKVFQMMAVERGVATEAGRALQAHKATITALEKNEARLAKYLSSKKTPQDVKDYIYRKIETFDGSPDEMSSLLRELNEATMLEKFVEYATAAKLWNPTTHAVNMVTSTTRMFLQSPIHAVSAAFDAVLSKLTGRPRERFLSDAVSEIQGQYTGWKHAGPEAMKALMDENYAFESRILKDFEVKGPAIKGRPGKNQLRDKLMDNFGKAVRIPFRMLGVEDTLIRKPSEMGALYTAINRKARMSGLKPGTKAWDEYVGRAINDPVGEFGVDFMREVQDIADQNLFQESMHPTLKRVSNWREDVPVMKLFVPFFRTIVNLQKQAIQFSALSPILPSSRAALKAGGGARSDVLAKMTLGTAATIPLVQHALEGNITMAAPTNPAERDAFYAEGKQPYSVRLGDTWYTYNRFSPFSEWFVTAAALAEALQNEDEKSMSELTSHVFFSMTQNFFDKSFATGMHDLMEALADPERAGNWVENFATGATVPNFIPLMARVVDPVIRETDDLRDAYISKVPYLSKTLDPKRDVFGEPISRPGNAIQKIISPVVPSPVEVDMVRDELSSIGYQMGFPGKTAGGFEMDDETYRIYQAASGKIIYKALAQMIQNPSYQNLSPRQREQAVDKIVREARELVKSQVAQEQLIMQEIKSELKNRGYSSAQADELAVKTYEIIKRKQQESQGQ